MSEIVKVRSICVDTLTAIQNEEYMTDRKKPGHDQWKDYGQGIYTFMSNIQQLGFEVILILGEPGTGKSSGMRTLPHNTNVWYNADNKNPIWDGGKEEYGKKTAPRAPYHVIPTTYGEIIAHIKAGLDKGMFEGDRYAFITGHTETYKVGNDTKERLKVLGKVATKMQLEGKMETVLYSRVEIESGKPVYILETQNNGYNTARSPMSLFEDKISNDYQLILEKLSTY
jgi:hypothetical protein